MDTNTKPNIAELTPRERHQRILVREAAELAGLSEKVFREKFKHLIRKFTPRCHRVELIDALTLPPSSVKDVSTMDTTVNTD
jgi:hypothetical protein